MLTTDELMATIVIMCRKPLTSWPSSFYGLVYIWIQQRLKQWYTLVVLHPRIFHLVDMLIDMISLFQIGKIKYYKRRACAPKCNKSMNCQSLTIHLHEIHKLPSLQIPEIHCSDPGQQYIVDFPIQNVQTTCPVDNCPAEPKTQTLLWWHFCTMHHEDAIIIVQEGELPRCPNCRMFVTSVTPRHVVGSAWCRIQPAWVQEHEQVARLASMAITLDSISMIQSLKM